MARFATVQELAVADWQEVASFGQGLDIMLGQEIYTQVHSKWLILLTLMAGFPETVNEWQAVKGWGDRQLAQSLRWVLRSLASSVMAMSSV